MKNLIFITLLALLGMSQAVAQEYEYVPFVREGVKWVYHKFHSDAPYSPPNMVPLTLEFKGEAEINGKTYKAMHKYYGDAINEDNDTIPIYMREEDKVVYGIIPDGRWYEDCLIYVLFTFNEYSGEEFIIYDFNDQDAFWESRLNQFLEESYGGCLAIDIIQLGSHQAKRYTNLYCGNEFYCIEGVGIDQYTYGYTLGFFMPFWNDGTGTTFHLSHVIEEGKIIYKGIWYDVDNMTGLDEVQTDQPNRHLADDNYYNLMGQPVGTELPTTPGIYIQNRKKIVVR